MPKRCFSAEARADIATIAQLASTLSLSNAHPSSIVVAHTQACLEATDTALKQVRGVGGWSGGEPGAPSAAA